MCNNFACPFENNEHELMNRLEKKVKEGTTSAEESESLILIKRLGDALYEAGCDAMGDDL